MRARRRGNNFSLTVGTILRSGGAKSNALSNIEAMLESYL